MNHTVQLKNFEEKKKGDAGPKTEESQPHQQSLAHLEAFLDQQQHEDKDQAGAVRVEQAEPEGAPQVV